MAAVINYFDLIAIFKIEPTLLLNQIESNLTNKNKAMEKVLGNTLIY